MENAQPPDLCAALGAALLLPIAQLISLAAVARARAPVLRGRPLDLSELTLSSTGFTRFISETTYYVRFMNISTRP